MESVPINFEHEGITYKGHFEPVHGGASANTWHLMIDKFYCGRLRLHNIDWVFDPTPKTGSFVNLSDYFGYYITAWYQ